MAPPILKLEDVSLSFGGTPLLDGVDLQLSFAGNTIEREVGRRVLTVEREREKSPGSSHQPRDRRRAPPSHPAQIQVGKSRPNYLGSRALRCAAFRRFKLGTRPTPWAVPTAISSTVSAC